MIVHYSEHASNERTFLSWVRTVIAIEGFGIAAARLGDTPASPVTQTAMLGAGALVLGLAFLRMQRIRARIEREEAFDDEARPVDALLLALVAALFALLAVFGLHVS